MIRPEFIFKSQVILFSFYLRVFRDDKYVCGHKNGNKPETNFIKLVKKLIKTCNHIQKLSAALLPQWSIFLFFP